MLLAGDIGGTKTLLGVFDDGPPRPAPVAVEGFTTAGHAGLEPLVSAFLDRVGVAASSIAAAAFGVAGPVRDQAATLTNVDWQVDGRAIARATGIARITVINDLVAMAYAVPVLAPDDLHVLQRGDPSPDGHAALIAAGTGLGEALLLRVRGEWVPSPTEAGHADWAPRTARDAEVAQAIGASAGRVAVEHVVSGPGLVAIHRALHRGGAPCPARQASGAVEAAAVSAAALSGACPRCAEALDLFIGAYGAEAGNLALRSMATAGVYVGGGIAPAILSAIAAGPFLAAFRAKSPMDDLMASIPVAVILHREVGLLGAAVAAGRAAGQAAVGSVTPGAGLRSGPPGR